MKIFRLEKSINLPITIEECWEFFSNPNNLKVITPKYMGFDILDFCLLYTSPSPRDKRQSRMPSSA